MRTLAAHLSRETHTPRASLAARRTLPAVLSRGLAGPRRICSQCAHWDCSRRTGSGICDESLGSAHAGATETRVMCTLEPIPSQPLTRAATSSNPMCTLVAVPSHGLRGRCDDLGSNVHIRPPFVAELKRARDGFAGNVHMGSISVAEAGKGTRRIQGQCVHSVQFRRMVPAGPRRITRQCAHWRPPRRGLPSARPCGADPRVPPPPTRPSPHRPQAFIDGPRATSRRLTQRLGRPSKRPKPSASANQARESRAACTLAQGLARLLTPPPRSPRHRRQR